MKKILAMLLALVLIVSMAVPVYACTEEDWQKPDWCGWLDWWRGWFTWIPGCPEQTEPAQPTEPEIVLSAPKISDAKYVHKAIYYGMTAHLEISWNEVKNAEYYEVLITKADGTTEKHTTESTLIYHTGSCPRVYMDEQNLWAAATVRVRAVAGGVYGPWSEEMKISCDMIH